MWVRISSQQALVSLRSDWRVWAVLEESVETAIDAFDDGLEVLLVVDEIEGVDIMDL